MSKPTRFRLTVTAVREYTPKPANYPDVDDDDIAGMVAVDQEALDDDPFVMIDDPNADWNVIVEDITGCTTDQQVDEEGNEI
jgi:hypothetical protein